MTPRSDQRNVAPPQNALAQQFTRRAVGSIDRTMRIGAPLRIGIGNRDATGRLSSAGNERLIVLVIEQGIRGVRIAVRPAIHRDGYNVAITRESAWCQHAVEFIADLGLDLIEAHLENLLPADSKLITRVETLIGGAGHMRQVQAHRLRRRAGMAVAAETYRIIELDAAMERHRRGDRVDPESNPGTPISDHDLIVEDRRLDVLGEGLSLRVRQLRHDVWNQHIEAGEHDMLASDV